MAVRDDFSAGEVLAAADLNDTFASKLDLAGGKILQIVRATDSTLRSTTSTSYVDVTGMSVTITPQKSDSALIVAAIFVADVPIVAARTDGVYALVDSSSNGLSGTQTVGAGVASPTGVIWIFPMTLVGYVTPATTSAATYKLRHRTVNASTAQRVRNDQATGQMYAIEVSA